MASVVSKYRFLRIRGLFYMAIMFIYSIGITAWQKNGNCIALYTEKYRLQLISIELALLDDCRYFHKLIFNKILKIGKPPVASFGLSP